MREQSNSHKLGRKSDGRVTKVDVLSVDLGSSLLLSYGSLLNGWNAQFVAHHTTSTATCFH